MEFEELHRQIVHTKCFRATLYWSINVRMKMDARALAVFELLENNQSLDKNFATSLNCCYLHNVILRRKPSCLCVKNNDPTMRIG